MGVSAVVDGVVWCLLSWFVLMLYTWDVAIDNLLEVWQQQIEIHNS